MGDSENELQGLTTRLDERARVGSILSKDGTSTKEIKIRVAVAMSAMSRLDTIWKSRNISLQTKLKLYRALAVSILLYGCGSWTLTAETERRIQNKQTPLLESKSPCLTRFNKICHPSQRPRWQVDKEAIGLSRVQQCSPTYNPPS